MSSLPVFGGHQLNVGLGGVLALCADSEDVALNVQVQRVELDARKVKGDDEFTVFLPGIHRHGSRAGGGSKDLLREPVQFTERVRAHQHHFPLLQLLRCCFDAISTPHDLWWWI
jgi:hypothetical protein